MGTWCRLTGSTIRHAMNGRLAHLLVCVLQLAVHRTHRAEGDELSSAEDTFISFSAVQPHNWIKGEIDEHRTMWSMLEFRLPPSLSRERIEEALDWLFVNYEMLRARVGIRNGETGQIVDPASAELRPVTIELSVDEKFHDGSAGERKVRLMELLQLDVSKSGHLVGIIQHRDSCALYLFVHHLFVDAYALRLLRSAVEAALFADRSRMPIGATAAGRGLSLYSTDKYETLARLNLEQMSQAFDGPVEGSPFDSLKPCNGQAWRLCNVVLPLQWGELLKRAACAFRTTVPALVNAAVCLVLQGYGPCRSPVIQTVVLNRETALDMEVVACLSNDSFIFCAARSEMSEQIASVSRAHIKAMRSGWFDQIALNRLVSSATTRYGADLSAITNLTMVRDEDMPRVLEGSRFLGCWVGAPEPVLSATPGVNPVKRPWDPRNQHLYVTAFIGRTQVGLGVYVTDALAQRRDADDVCHDLLSCLELLIAGRDVNLAKLPVPRMY